jgi:hypothetical protein
MVSCTIVLTFWLEEILGLQHREVVKEIWGSYWVESSPGRPWKVAPVVQSVGELGPTWKVQKSAKWTYHIFVYEDIPQAQQRAIVKKPQLTHVLGNLDLLLWEVSLLLFSLLLEVRNPTLCSEGVSLSSKIGCYCYYNVLERRDN